MKRANLRWFWCRAAVKGEVKRARGSGWVAGGQNSRALPPFNICNHISNILATTFYSQISLWSRRRGQGHSWRWGGCWWWSPGWSGGWRSCGWRGRASSRGQGRSRRGWPTSVWGPCGSCACRTWGGRRRALLGVRRPTKGRLAGRGGVAANHLGKEDFKSCIFLSSIGFFSVLTFLLTLTWHGNIQSEPWEMKWIAWKSGKWKSGKWERKLWR